MGQKGEDRIREYMESLRLEEPVSPEEFHQAVKSAYKDRSAQVYFIWEKAQGAFIRRWTPTSVQ